MSDIEGVPQLFDALEDYARQMQKRAHDAMVEITTILQADAQDGHTFTNQTGNLENSIVGDVEEVSALVVSGYLAATMDYAQFVELAHQGKWAYLMPTIERRKDDIQTILKRHLEQ